MELENNNFSDWLSASMKETKFRHQGDFEDLEFFKKITKTLPNLIYVFNIKENESVFFNRRILDLIGYSDEDIQKMGPTILFQVIHPEDIGKVLELISNYKTAPDGEIHTLEFRVLKKNGDIAWFIDRSQVFRRDQNGTPIEIIGVVEDVSESRITSQMLQMEKARSLYNAKMASLGQLSGQIAHEINNPLTIILCRLEQVKNLLQKDQPDKIKIFEFIAKMESTTERMAQIIKGLRGLSRNGENDPFIEVTLKSLCEDAISIIQEKFRFQQVDLQIDAIPDVEINCQPVQISQIFLNLLQNALDAVEVQNPRWVRFSFEKEKDWVNIYISDSGRKIDPIVASKMMEPFFTTKKADKGTGLGLSISYEIAKKHNGLLSYEPTENHTRFLLKLPVSHEELSSTRQ